MASKQVKRKRTPDEIEALKAARRSRKVKTPLTFELKGHSVKKCCKHQLTCALKTRMKDPHLKHFNEASNNLQQMFCTACNNHLKYDWKTGWFAV